ncbi:MAG: flagellar biosynthesis protein FlhF [Kangiellaceae bacterium]|nr:flagellar biosynthesis protein FlhF [Kangiellaceae bacterium]MCW8999932.1 flagellar biosynthesis protein FlhF [Kangiellaceae bacterium]
MKIRRFYGINVRTALKQVTDEFGEDAAILSNKKVPGGVEVIAALDYDESLMPETMISDSSAAADPQTEIGTGVEEKRPHQESDIAPTNEPLGASNQIKADDDLSSGFRSFLDSLHNETPSHSNNAIEPAENRTQVQVSDNAKLTHESQIPNLKQDKQVEWSLDPSLQAMREELGLMRSMMSEQLKGLGWNRFVEKNPVGAMLTRRLASLGLKNELIEHLLPNVKSDADAECAWQQVLALFAKSLPVFDEQVVDSGGIFALLGPTGVGKTTTIAKLAARFVIKHGHDSVALITTDNYRISAFEQLATFGRILQLPTSKVSDHQSLNDLLKKYANKKLVLIDTAGVSSRDSALMSQLSSLNSCQRSVNKILLVSAASQAGVIEQSLKLFEESHPTGLIITKLDETTSLGEVLSIVMQQRLPVYYTTDGQRVPEDIRHARSHHLVSKAVWLANKYTKKIDDWELAQGADQVRSA